MRNDLFVLQVSQSGLKGKLEMGNEYKGGFLGGLVSISKIANLILYGLQYLFCCGGVDVM